MKSDMFWARTGREWMKKAFDMLHKVEQFQKRRGITWQAFVFQFDYFNISKVFAL